MIVLYIVATFVYLTIAGATFSSVLDQRRRVCRDRNCGGGAECWHEGLAALAAALWLLLIPLILGHLLNKKTAHNDGLTKTERRRKSKIEEADHKLEVAKINAKTLAIQEQGLGIGHL